MNVHMCLYSSKHHPDKGASCHHPRKFPLAPSSLQGNRSFPIFYHHPEVLPLLEFCIYGIMQYGVFLVWLLLLCTRTVRLVQVAVCRGICLFHCCLIFHSGNCPKTPQFASAFSSRQRFCCFWCGSMNVLLQASHSAFVFISLGDLRKVKAAGL